MRVFMLCACLALTWFGTALGSWQSPAPGLDLGIFQASRPAQVGDSRITVLRIDPHAWELVGSYETAIRE